MELMECTVSANNNTYTEQDTSYSIYFLVLIGYLCLILSGADLIICKIILVIVKNIQLEIHSSAIPTPNTKLGKRKRQTIEGEEVSKEELRRIIIHELVKYHSKNYMV